MDMDSSRRSFDRSRELGVKKPRLGDEIDRDRNLNTRGYPQQRPAAAAAAVGGTGLLGSRFRASERDDPSRGGGAYTPQPLHSELVSQYKTALAELTFNSKPIITNLTIIAGESLHAAKAIAATICSNIIEVPSDQKLPSLYLLDSIVKNIGRDYIKYFAARLPEVFCKAYRQVESSMHSGMRHLFGTWKGVFPPQCLQMIEKELGFSSTVNGTSSAVTASKSNSQSQRQPHSIHVNPKYLEARQRLQTNRAKGLTNELTGSLDDPNEDVDRLERTAGNSTARTWTDLPVKAHNIHRSLKEAGGDPVLEKNDVAAYGDHEYSSDLSRAPGLGIGRGSERASNLGQDKTRYTARSGVAEALNSQKNGFDIKNKFPGYLGHRSTSTDLHPQTTQGIGSQSGIISRSWKNSEEEEYIWDDMNPRLKDHGVPRSSRKDRWTPDNSEKMEFENIPRKPQRLNDVVSKVEVHASSEQKERALFGHQTSSPWSNQESNSVDGLDPLLCSAIISAPLEESNIVLNGLPTSACSLNRTGFRLQTMPSHSGNIGQWPSSRGSASPSGRSPVHQKPLFSASHPPQLYHTLAEQDQSEVQSMSRPDSKAVQVSGQLNRGLHRQNNINHDFTTMPQNTLRGNLQKMQSQNLNTPSNSLPLSSFQSMNPKPYSSQMHVESAQPKPSLPKKKPPLPQISNFSSQPTVGNASPDHSKSFTSGSPAQSNPSSLLAALMKSGILSNNKPSVEDTNSAQLQSANQLSLLSGPLSAQFTSSGPMVASTPLLGSHSDDDSSNSSNSLKRKAECPSLPLALPASSSPTVGPPAQISSQESNTANPISNLLSSLVAKGLISSSKTESQSIVPPLMSTTPENQNADIATSSPVPVASAPISSVPVSLTTFASSSKEKGSLLEPDAKRAAVISESTTGEIENLIGFGFKPDVIRESHPSVISFLFDDFPYQCNSCGIQLRIKEQHDRHLEWHTLIEHEPDRSRKWYLHSSDWIARGIDSGFNFTNLVAGPCKEVEDEPMVPADESQCLCILCGELFEDFYCQEKDEWMFKGAMYMSVPPRCDETVTAEETAAQGPIVHQKCISESSVYDLGLANSIKMEEDK